MADQSNDWPDEGELVVCSVKSVKENGAYLSLDTYPDREGFVFIGEIATGWVRNIRAHVREGQRLVAKVIGVKKDRDSITLNKISLRREKKRCLAVVEERAACFPDHEGGCRENWLEREQD